MAELKISDLSVGDWIQIDEGSTPVSIKSIHSGSGQDYVIVNDNFYDEGIIVFAYAVKPIPITPEILEKNGLCVVKEDADFSEYELFGSENFSIFHTKGTFHYRLETPQASVVCWNVHQLQHALRLAGVEKEIEV